MNTVAVKNMNVKSLVAEVKTLSVENEKTIGTGPFLLLVGSFPIVMLPFTIGLNTVLNSPLALFPVGIGLTGTAAFLISAITTKRSTRKKLHQAINNMENKVKAYMYTKYKTVSFSTYEMDRILVALLSNKSVTEFTGQNKKTYVLSAQPDGTWSVELKTIETQKPETETADPKVWVWDKKTKALHTSVQKKKAELADTLMTVEQQHVLERATNDLEEMIDLLVRMKGMANLTQNEKKEVTTALTALDNELGAILKQHQKDLKRQLKVNTSFIHERNISQLNSLSLERK